ncbi:MAG: thiol oxidoreductase [Thermoleophilia bacterium]|nr:thiol oxidoreductase [Thermoleophilia bacterium]
MSAGRNAGAPPAPVELLDALSGGDTTALDATTNAFGLAARNLGREERRAFEIGDSLFTQNWVTAPASTANRDGLGPLLNAQACASCHVFDGRAKPPTDPDDPERGLLLRLGVSEGDTESPHPVYGDQLQDRAILGVDPEAQFVIDTTDVPGTYGDGTPYTLQRPTYRITDPAYGPLGRNLLLSPRIAPQLVGMGLLDAVPEAQILASADPKDADGDGISGRPNRVRDIQTGRAVVGRLGWKANVANTRDQTAGAFRGDIGVTSRLAPEEPCTPSQTACNDAPTGPTPQLDDEALDRVTFYVTTLAVPGRRNLDDPAVTTGARFFQTAGCTGCHTPTMTTSASDVTSAVEHQTIHPYSDLLLHDMGDGLADGKRDGRATGREWRTQPLWGIGLVEPINGHTRFLHDGRARNLEEAILWHGGEAVGAREAFRTADRATRDALITFLESL